MQWRADATKPQSCEECAQWTITRQFGWDMARQCRPTCVFRALDPFVAQALQLWSFVGHGEVVDSETGSTNYSIDWGAFREARDCGHPVFAESDPADLFEAMIIVHRDMQSPPSPAEVQALFDAP